MPKASIIVPTYNGSQKISNILRSLEFQTVKDFEVVVVIDGSTDGTRALLESNSFDLPDLILLEQKNGGRSVSRNAGARKAKSELLLFFDDDMRLEPDCVQIHLHHHTKMKDSILIGSAFEDFKLLTSDIQHYRAHLSRKWMKPISNLNRPLTKDQLFLTAANLSLTKELFFSLDGFDERLNDAEDFDLGVRAFLNNVPIYFNEQAIAWHDDFITCRSYINRLKQYNAAHNQLKALKPSLYKEFSHHQPKLPALHKQLVYKVLSNSLFVKLIDAGKFKSFLPKNLRYKLYDIIITSHISNLK